LKCKKSAGNNRQKVTDKPCFSSKPSKLYLPSRKTDVYERIVNKYNCKLFETSARVLPRSAAPLGALRDDLMNECA
jgi:hypothetical protein